ncbi:MAG: class I SAM-dependent methyltransferase [Terriglobales bacterium]
MQPPLPMDPWEIGQRSRWSPLRAALALRRKLEPRWYRRGWQRDPWRTDAPTLALAPEEETALQRLEEIRGSAITPEQAAALFVLAKDAPGIGEIVELGSDRGKSTIALAWGVQRSPQPCAVHAADPFVDTNPTHRRLRIELLERHLTTYDADNVSFHPLASSEFRAHYAQPLRLVFVDAAHDYLNSRFDFLAWKELLVPGGLLLAHDVDNPQWGAGTRHAFFDHVLADPRFRLVLHVENLAAAQRMG